MAWYNSSADAKKLSATIRGIFTIGLITTIVGILGFFGIQLDVTDFQELLNSVEGMLVALAIFVGSIQTLYGILRKIYLKGILPVINKIRNR